MRLCLIPLLQNDPYQGILSNKVIPFEHSLWELREIFINQNADMEHLFILLYLIDTFFQISVEALISMKCLTFVCFHFRWRVKMENLVFTTDNFQWEKFHRDIIYGWVWKKEPTFLIIQLYLGRIPFWSLNILARLLTVVVKWLMPLF